MTTGGPAVTFFGLSYADLTIADPYYSLPLLASLIFLISVELNAADGMQASLYSECWEVFQYQSEARNLQSRIIAFKLMNHILLCMHILLYLFELSLGA